MQYIGHISRFDHLGEDLQSPYIAGAVMHHCMPLLGILMGVVLSNTTGFHFIFIEDTRL